MTTSKTCLKIALLALVPPSAFAQGPRAEEARDLRRKIDANLVEELTKRWFPRSLESDGNGFHQTLRPRLVPLAPTTTARWSTNPG